MSVEPSQNDLEGALLRADAPALATLLRADRAAATRTLDGLAPLLVLLRRSTGAPAGVRACARLLLDGGADPASHTVEWGGDGRMSALFAAVDRRDLELARLLVRDGATKDEDAFYHACEQSDTAYLDLLHEPGFERMVNHKLDFEDADGLRWFLDHGVDVDANRCLHHAISRGRGLTIITMLLDAGADPDLPWDRWDVGRRPLALAARCGHLAAYELLASRGATAQLDTVDTMVLAVARGESVQLPTAPPPALGNPCRDDYGWILGQFALLGRTEIVRALLDSGMPVDTRGWSNFTPLEQAANARPRRNRTAAHRARRRPPRPRLRRRGAYSPGLRDLGTARQPRRRRRLHRRGQGSAGSRRPHPILSADRRSGNRRRPPPARRRCAAPRGLVSSSSSSSAPTLRLRLTGARPA